MWWKPRRDKDSKPEQELSFTPAAWGRWGPRALTWEWCSGQLAWLWALWHAWCAHVAWEARALKGPSKRSDLGFLNLAYNSRVALPQLPEICFLNLLPLCPFTTQPPFTRQLSVYVRLGHHCQSPNEGWAWWGAAWMSSSPIGSMQLSSPHLLGSGLESLAHHLPNFSWKLFTIIYGKNGGLGFTRMVNFKFSEFSNSEVLSWLTLNLIRFL